MGWTTTNRSHGQSIKDFFQEQFGGENSAGIKWDVVGCSAKVDVAYLAIRRTFPNGKVLISATVCRIQHSRDPYYNFGYKDMCETIGPGHAQCPKKILDMLSPLEEIADPDGSGYKWAKRWREDCWNYVEMRKARPKLSKGNIIQFDREFDFGDGFVSDTLEITSPYPRLRFRPIGSNDRGRYRVRRASLQRCNWQLVGSKGVLHKEQLSIANGVFDLLPDEVQQGFRKMGKQDSGNPTVLARFYNDLGWVWLPTEFDEDREVFWGFASLFHDHNDEWGSVALQDLQQSKFKRDLMFEPAPMSKVMSKAVVHSR